MQPKTLKLFRTKVGQQVARDVIKNNKDFVSLRYTDEPFSESTNRITMIACFADNAKTIKRAYNQADFTYNEDGMRISNWVFAYYDYLVVVRSSKRGTDYLMLPDDFMRAPASVLMEFVKTFFVECIQP